MPPHELVLVLVKSHQTEAIAPAAARAAGPFGFIVTLQNGLGNRELLERAAGRGRVGVGVTLAGATLLRPGEVRGHLAMITLGDDGAGRAARVCTLFREAGLDTQVEPNIDRVVWRKLAVNCALNPLSALEGVTNGALLGRLEWRQAIEAATHEVGAVAAARGIVLGDTARLALEVARLTAGNRSSMLQDLERGFRTEIDAINGAVVIEGRRLGVPTPLNEAFWNAVRQREAALAAGTGR
jgi:2-dehydropantoate 2-reductase